jgi:hypothetical protein
MTPLFRLFLGAVLIVAALIAAALYIARFLFHHLRG